MTVAQAPRETVIEGRRALVVENQSGLPRSLQTLLAEMAPFGFSQRADFPLAGARPSCEVLRVHRWQAFRVGHWSNPRPFPVVIGKSGETLQTTTVPAGVRLLWLEMCADCGAVMVRDVSTHGPMGGRAARIVNTQTGAERIAPAVGQRDLVIGWYSGKRRAGREFR